MKEPLVTNQELRLWVLLGQTRDIIARAIQKELEQFNVTYRQVAVLLVIRANAERITAAEISRQLFREPHTISAVLKRMGKQGLLTRHNDLSKKNLVRVALTEQGRKLCSLTDRRKAIRKIFSCLTEEEVGQLTSCLEKIKRQGMKEIGMKRDVLFLP